MARGMRALALGALLAACAQCAHASQAVQPGIKKASVVHTSLATPAGAHAAQLTFTLDIAALAARGEAAPAVSIGEIESHATADALRVATDGAPAALADDVPLPDGTGFAKATVAYTRHGVLLALEHSSSVAADAASTDGAVHSGTVRLASFGVLAAIAGGLAGLC